MVKIQVHDSAQQIIIQVEGQLAGIFAHEVERCWRAMDAKAQRSIVLDLHGVTQTDTVGRRLLRSMHRCGVTFIGAGLAMQDVLNEVMERNGTNGMV